MIAAAALALAFAWAALGTVLAVRAWLWRAEADEVLGVAARVLAGERNDRLEAGIAAFDSRGSQR